MLVNLTISVPFLFLVIVIRNIFWLLVHPGPTTLLFQIYLSSSPSLSLSHTHTHIHRHTHILIRAFVYFATQLGFPFFFLVFFCVCLCSPFFQRTSWIGYPPTGQCRTNIFPSTALIFSGKGRTTGGPYTFKRAECRRDPALLKKIRIHIWL